MAQRIVNAEVAFRESCRDQFGITDEDAEKVRRVFVKAKAMKLDVIGGTYRLAGGAFWEADVIRRAIKAFSSEFPQE